MLREREGGKEQRVRTGIHKTQQWVLENTQCVYSHRPFRLQAQQAFSDQQKFGSEIWDALDSNHEVSNHLQGATPSTHKVTPLCDNLQCLAHWSHFRIITESQSNTQNS